ncbi:hypothetical protein [Actinophytocola sp.]|jgi:hypothetical protein|uniref:hypothetical protein n=1 Tax=Actinophytocola sp. TaxID=1872138 RepID=UPI002EDAB011
MPVDDATAQRLRSVLGDETDTDVTTLRARMGPLFGAGWLEEADDQVQTNLTAWLTAEEAGQLATLVDGPPGELARWFGEVLDAWDSAGESAPRFTDVVAVEGYPGWWQAFDSAGPEAGVGYLYVRSTEQPTDQTPGWLGQTEAFAAMQAARFTDVVAVEGYPGWWRAFDSAEPEADGGYKYVRGTEQPTDRTAGWLGQTEAFAAMQTPAEAPPAEPAPAEVTAVVEQMLSEVMTGALADVDGAEELSPDEVRRALEEAAGTLAQ